MSSHAPSFFTRYFYSTNHKDIGVLYLVFAIIAGLIGGIFSLLIRMELAEPGMQIVGDDYQTYNVFLFFCILDRLSDIFHHTPRSLGTIANLLLLNFYN